MDPKSGIPIQNPWVSHIKNPLIKHLFSTILIDNPPSPSKIVLSKTLLNIFLLRSYYQEWVKIEKIARKKVTLELTVDLVEIEVKHFRHNQETQFKEFPLN